MVFIFQKKPVAQFLKNENHLQKTCLVLSGVFSNRIGVRYHDGGA